MQRRLLGRLWRQSDNHRSTRRLSLAPTLAFLVLATAFATFFRFRVFRAAGRAAYLNASSRSGAFVASINSTASSSSHPAPSPQFLENSSSAEEGGRSSVAPARGSDGVTSKLDAARLPPRVFIGIKTGDGPKSSRFGQIRRTWLRDALDGSRRGSIDIKFFTRDSELESVWASNGNNSSSNSSHSAANDWRDEGDDDENGFSLRSLFVPTHCPREKKDIVCAMSSMFQYYIDNHGNGTYFCSFDDDQYVVVKSLLRVLDEYDDDESSFQGGGSKDLYVGRQHENNKDGVRFSGMGAPIRYLTGGAGYCLSRHLVERGRLYFSDIGSVWRRFRIDDVAVGYVVTRLLGANITEDYRFHSHYDEHLRTNMSLKEVPQQVSFGYNTKFVEQKQYRHRANLPIPNVPVLFPWEDDRMLFHSLWCFLAREEDTGKGAPSECIPPSMQANTTASDNNSTRANNADWRRGGRYNARVFVRGKKGVVRGSLTGR